MKIKAQIFLVGLLLSILPMGLVSVLLITFYNKELDKIAIDNLQSITMAQSDIIDNFFFECDVSLSILSDYEMINNLMQHNYSDSQVQQYEKRTMEEIFRVQKEKRDFIYSITAFDSNFQIVACSERVEQDSTAFLKASPVLHKLNDGIWISHILDNGERGARYRCLVVAKAVFNEQDDRIGYLVEEIALNFFENMRLETQLSQEGSVYIVDGNGGIISAGTSRENIDSYLLQDNQRNGFSEAWESRDKEQTVGVLRYKIAGKTYLSSYGGFKNSDWQIISSICLDDILHTRENCIAVLLIAAIVTILLVVTINSMMRRMISEPIEQIVRTFNEIRKNNDYAIRIKGLPHNEIGQIAGEVNILLEDIEDTISHHRKRLKILKERAQRDPLTGLFNHNAINEVLAMKIDDARVKREMLACVLVDIDDFKNFNTQFGHAGGDCAIRFVADVMREISGDTAGRIGGDEFVMYINNFSTEQEVSDFMESFFNRLRKGIDITGKGDSIPVHCSAGVALLQGRNEPNSKSVLEMADKAMYKAKNLSKNSYYVTREHSDS